MNGSIETLPLEHVCEIHVHLDETQMSSSLHRYFKTLEDFMQYRFEHIIKPNFFSLISSGGSRDKITQRLKSKV